MDDKWPSATLPDAPQLEQSLYGRVQGSDGTWPSAPATVGASSPPAAGAGAVPLPFLAAAAFLPAASPVAFALAALGGALALALPLRGAA